MNLSPYSLSSLSSKLKRKPSDTNNIDYYDAKSRMQLDEVINSYSESMSHMINATRLIISKYMPKCSLKSIEDSKNATFKLCILDPDQTIESLKGFFMKLVVNEKDIKIKVIFTIKYEIFKIPERLVGEFLKLISIINLDQDLGYFNILNSNILQLELDLWYRNLEIPQVQNLIWPYIKKAANIYSRHVRQFYWIMNQLNATKYQLLNWNAYQTNIGTLQTYKRPKSCPSSDSETEEDLSISNFRREINQDEDSESDEYEEYSFSDASISEDSHQNDTETITIIDFIQSSPNLNNFFGNYNTKNLETGFICIALWRFLEIYSLPKTLFDDILLVLEKMYNHRLEFIEFPFQNINIFGTEEKGYTFFFIYEGIDKVANIRDENEIEFKTLALYRADLINNYSVLYLNRINNYMHFSDKIEESGYIPPTEFKSVNLTDNKLHIGQGAYGDVYKNELHGMKVAIKLPKEGKEVSARAKKRILKEMTIMKSLCHDNITKLLGHTIYNNKFGLVIEYCSNGTLSDYVINSKEAKFQERLEFLLGISRGLEFMHCKNICHFDLKPQNIFLDENYIPKIAEFGMSENLQKGLSTPPGFTLHYCAPEHIKGNNPNQSADIWSFGMTAYFLIMQKSPFDYFRKGITGDLEPEEFCRKVEKDNKRPEISEFFRRHLPQIVRLFEWTWELKPESRPSAKDVGCLINKWLISLKKKIVKVT